LQRNISFQQVLINAAASGAAKRTHIMECRRVPYGLLVNFQHKPEI